MASTTFRTVMPPGRGLNGPSSRERACLPPPRIFFFFSSRRRHTRSLCDWSSDVCSSDLEMALPAMARKNRQAHFSPTRAHRDVHCREHLQLLVVHREEAVAPEIDALHVEIGRASCRERV